MTLLWHLPGPRVFAALAGVLIAGCAPTNLLPNTALAVTSERIAPYEFHEICAELEAGDRVDYRYEATEPVAFTIGYREDGATLLPWTRDYLKSDSGIFPVRYAQHYCLKWQGGPPGALLTYHVIVHRAER
jgi:hypothetical protein